MSLPQQSSTDQPQFLEQQRAEKSTTPRRAVPAWLMSLVFHSAIFGIGIFLIGNINKGGSNVESRAGGIVLVDAKSETTEYLSEGEVDDSASDSAAKQQQSPPPFPAEDELPDLPGMNASQSKLTGVGDDFDQVISGADSLLNGMGSNRPVGGKVTTEIFGVKGTGSVFVYVFDRSASMEGYSGKPLRAAKKQLVQSIDSLGEQHQFQIVFYNDRSKIFRSTANGQTSRLVFAEVETKKRAFRFINGIRGDGGTDHLQALKEALRMGPDVIFLLTDAEGGFTKNELNSLARWNRSGAVINAIEFGVGKRRGSDRSLEQLANESGGQYTYKNVLSFRD